MHCFHLRATLVYPFLAISMGTLAAEESAPMIPVTAARKDNQVVFRAGDREIARYQAEPGPLPRPDIDKAYRRGGYLHPLRTPSGAIVTDDYPVNHTHHHGIWMPWTKVVFQGRATDFWNMGQKKGRVEFDGIDSIAFHEGVATLTTRHRFVDLTSGSPVTALHETWQVTVRAFGGSAPRHQIDLVSTQTCATSDSVELPEYHYGGLGFRGLAAWDGRENCRFLTSEGITDRIQGNESRGKWCWIGGSVPASGATAGVTMLCHADNFRFPQPMRLHPKEPFFCYAPQQLGPMAIRPGESYVSRYRIVITDGEVRAPQAEAWWTDFSRTAP